MLLFGKKRIWPWVSMWWKLLGICNSHFLEFNYFCDSLSYRMEAIKVFVSGYKLKHQSLTLVLPSKFIKHCLPRGGGCYHPHTLLFSLLNAKYQLIWYQCVGTYVFYSNQAKKVLTFLLWRIVTSWMPTCRKILIFKKFQQITKSQISHL